MSVRFVFLVALTISSLFSLADAEADAPTASFKSNTSEPASRTTLSAYRAYLKSQADTLVGMTKVLAREIKDGNLEAAQSAYAPAHGYLARIAPVARLSGDLIQRMDGRPEAYDGDLKHPVFSGFHRIEYALFAKRSIDGLSPYADQLAADARELREWIAQVDIDTGRLIASAAALTKDLATRALDGSYERYAKSELWDVEAEVEGVREIVSAARPQLQVRDPNFFGQTTITFAKLGTLLEAHKDGCGFKSFDTLGTPDKLALRASLTDLSESLSTLSASLAMD